MKKFSITVKSFLPFLAKLNRKRRHQVLKHMSPIFCSPMYIWRMYQNIKVNIYHLLSQRKAAQIVKVLLIVHTRPKCTYHMYQTVLNCPNHLINQEQSNNMINSQRRHRTFHIPLIHFCPNILFWDCRRRESRKWPSSIPSYSYVSGVCSMPLKCGLDSDSHSDDGAGMFVDMHCDLSHIYVW